MMTGIMASLPVKLRDVDGPVGWDPVPTESLPIVSGTTFSTVATDGNGTWVAAGRQGSAGRILRSNDDAETWTFVGDPNAATGTNLIRWVNDAFYGFTYNRPGSVIRSVDGVSWSSYATTTGISGYVWEVRIDPNDSNRVWLVASDGLRLSTNGMAGPWSNVTGSIFGFTIKDLATDGNGTWVVVGGGANDQPPGKLTSSINNGSSWGTVLTLDNNSGARFDCVTHTGTHWVIGSNNRVWYSDNRTNWSQAIVSGYISSILYNPVDGSLVGAGGSQTPAISRDSISTWKNVPVSGQTITYTDIACSPTKWIIVGTRMLISPVAKG